MLIDTLRGLTRAVPFKPFRLYISTGDVFEVRHQEMIFATDEAAYIHLPVPVGPPEAPHRLQIVGMMHIQKFDYVEAPATSKSESNGTL